MMCDIWYTMYVRFHVRCCLLLRNSIHDTLLLDLNEDKKRGRAVLVNTIKETGERREEKMKNMGARGKGAKGQGNMGKEEVKEGRDTFIRHILF